MGKSYSNWFSRFLRRKKPPRHQLSSPSFVGELGGGSCSGYSSINSVDVDPEKHAIAVAAATAAVAQAALAAAKAAAEVVRMTRGRRKNLDEFAAAVKIQSAFRGYLARRALRALKGLVKLQALVRGHFVRKRSAEMLRRMQAMFRVQARAVASRTTVQSTVDHPNNNSTTDTTISAPALMRRSTETQHQTRSWRLNEASIFKRCGSVSSARDMRSSSFDLLNQRTQRQEQDNWRMEFDCASHSSMRMAHQTEEEEDQNLNDKILEIDSSWRPSGNNNHHHRHREYYSSMSLSHLRLNNHHRQKKKPSSNYALSPCDLDSDDVVSLRSLQFFPMESNHYYMGSPQQPYPFRTGTVIGTGTGSSLRGRKSAGRTTYTSTEAFSSPSMRNQYESAELLGLGSRTRGFVGPDCYINSIGYYHPNYMANTESSRAKVRSQSAPKQRLSSELSPETVGSMTNRSINYDCSDFKASSRGGSINSPYV